MRLIQTGPGIPENELEKVFDQFHRVEKSRFLLHPGAGPGLSIAKRIVQIHGGRIWKEIRFGQWARAQVILPVVPA